MNKTTILAIAVSSMISTGVLAARIPYAVLQAPHNFTCHSNVSGACSDNVSFDPCIGAGVSYYDTAAHELVVSTPFESHVFDFTNNKSIIQTCTSNPPMGDSQPEPLSYCQNPQNYYDLSSETLTYHPGSQYMTATATDYYTFDNNGSIGWVNLVMSGLVMSPGNAL